MKLVKLLIHSAPAGGLFALLLATLLFYLNPVEPLTGGSLWSVWRGMTLPCGVLAALVLPLGLLVIRFFAERPLRLPWLSFGLFHRFYLVDASLAAVIWWVNFFSTPDLLSPADRRMLLAGCGLLTLGCALGGLLSLQRVVFPMAVVRAGQAILLIALFAGLAWVRGGTEAPEPQGTALPELEGGPTEGRVVLAAVDGLSLDLILPLAADGRAPTFRHLMRQGASGRMESRVPTAPPVIWTTMATGLLPYEHGILDFVRYTTADGRVNLSLAPRFLLFRRLGALGYLKTVPVTSENRLSPALWNILSQFGMEVHVLEWRATFPPEPIRGRVVPFPPGDREVPVGSWTGWETDDPLLTRQVEDRLARLADWDASPGPGGEALEEIVRRSLILDLRVLDRARRLDTEDRPAALAFYLPGLDAVQHYFLGYALTAVESEGADRRDVLYGEVVSRYYRFLDESLASFLDAEEGPRRLLMVLSGFGVERAPPWKLLRVLARGPVQEGVHDRAPSGAYFALGEGIVQGLDGSAAKPVDVLPTLLYYLGLPVGRDMHGRPRIDWFSDEFVSTHPLGFVPSYRTVRGVPPRAPEGAGPPS